MRELEGIRCYDLVMRRTKTLIPVFLIVLGAVLLAMAIRSALNGADSVTGQVVSVESGSITTFSSLVIEDSSGTEWTFSSSGRFSGFTPSHLEEHRALHQPVTVKYTELDDGQLRVLSISD